MGHGHGHHHHHHGDDFAASGDVPAALDASIPDSELSPGDLSRRGFLRNAGIVGVGAAAAATFAGAGSASAHDDHDDHHHSGANGLLWLAGDHHIHTKYSSDAQYRVNDHVRHASAYGLGWMVITDHGSLQHAKIGVEKVNPEIKAARSEFKDTLVFQGFEWNIPGAEHGTVFVHPGQNEVAVLKEFENSFDGSVTNSGPSTPANEALAITGLNFLKGAVAQKRVDDALFLANHPARKGLDSPHELRGWRDTAPGLAVGMEGAPGHQAAGIKAPTGPGSGRGAYDNSPTADSFQPYPLESYRTWGGFDWMTATVGGLWDSLLAEGKPWWITANSDSHQVYADSALRGGGDFNTQGYYNDPVYGQPVTLTNSDFWPGYYSKTHVGAKNFSYAAVMDGIRHGRVWVDHGGLIKALDVQVRVKNTPFGVTLGDTLQTRRGAQVELVITIQLADRPNWAQFVPKLARVDVIAGKVGGPVADKDVFKAPDTKVVKAFDTSTSTGTVTLKYTTSADGPMYFRIRGTDGNRSQPGTLGAAIDPAGPALDVVGDADPWKDLWFYANPIWVLTH
jgi:hypothetical protein